MFLALLLALLGFVAADCPVASVPYVTCAGTGVIALDTTSHLTLTDLNSEIIFLKSQVFPHIHWDTQQKIAVYGVASKTPFYLESNNLNSSCDELDYVQSQVLTNGQNTMSLKDTLLSVIQTALNGTQQANITFFSAEPVAANIAAAGQAVTPYVSNGSVTFFVVALNNAPFTSNNFPTSNLYHVALTNVNNYIGLPFCIMRHLCGDQSQCDPTVPAGPAPTFPIPNGVMTTTASSDSDQGETTAAQQTTQNVPVRTTQQPIQTTQQQQTTMRQTVPPQTTTANQFFTTATPPDADDNHHCHCNYSTIWNDVMVVLDSSQEATQDGFDLMLNVVQSQLNFLTIQTAESSTTEFHTRLGIITYSDTATVQYPLGSLNGSQLEGIQELPYDGGNKANIQSGLQAASEQFKTVYDRKNARNVIILMTRAYDPTGTISPMDTADEFKANGGVIIIYDFALSQKDAHADLEQVASPGYYFISGEDRMGNILDQSLCDANCFCPIGSVPYAKNTQYELPEGGCYYTGIAQMNQALAKRRCAEYGGVLAEDRDANKTSYLQTVAPLGDSFWLGLTWDSIDRQYYWSDNTLLSGNYQPFLNYQTPSSRLACVYSYQGSWIQADCRISKYYVCEMSQCDSETYCASNKL